MLECLSGSSTSQQPGVGSGGVAFGELVEGHHLSACLENFSSSGFRDSETTDPEFFDFEETLIIEDGADNAENFVSFVFSVGELGKFGDGDGVTGGIGLVESSKDDLIELGVGSPGQELVEFDEESEVDVGGGGVPDFVSFDDSSLFV